MSKIGFALKAGAMALVLAASGAVAQGGAPDVDAIMAEQKAAMDKLAWMDGEWSGKATYYTGDVAKTLVQTESIRSAIDGTVKIVEGRGYGENGVMEFNAVAVLSYDAQADEYRMLAHTRGMSTEPRFDVTDNGLRWSIEQGPVRIEYVATYIDGTWREVGTMTMPGREPFKFVEMELRKR